MEVIHIAVTNTNNCKIFTNFNFLIPFSNLYLNFVFFLLLKNRKIGKLGLRRNLNKKKHLMKDYKLMKAMAFLPPADVLPTFKAMEISPELHRFTSYFQKTYIGSERKSATFPPEMWSVTGVTEQDLPRTTNCAEGFHSKVQKLANSKILSLIKLIKVLKIIALDSLDLIMTFNNGYSWPRKPKKATVEKEKRILQVMGNKKKNMYSDNIDFLKAIAHNLSLN